MKLSKKLLLPVYFLVIIFILGSGILQFNTHADTSKTGIITVSPVYTREKPHSNSPIVGAMKKGQKVQVYSINKNGWAEIEWKGKQRVYIPKDTVDFTLRPSDQDVQRIVEKTIALQHETWKDNLTKHQIIQKMSPGFSTEFIQQYIHDDMVQKGKNQEGEPLYHVRVTDSGKDLLWSFNWKSAKKPDIMFSHEGKTQILIISQYVKNEEAGDHERYLFLEKTNPNTKWKVYQYKDIY